MTNKVIVCTTEDGAVAIVHPTPECLKELKQGRVDTLDRDWEIFKFVNEPHWRPDRKDREKIAATWIDALINGGVEGDAALELIALKDAPAYATGIEFWDRSEVPSDRWFRNAWRRSPNGGPIRIDLDKARDIQFARIRNAVEIEDQRRHMCRQMPGPLTVDWTAIVEHIATAEDEHELRKVWPQGLHIT